MKRILGVVAVAALLAGTQAVASDLPALRGPMRASAVEDSSSGFFGMDTRIIDIGVGIAVLLFVVLEHGNSDHPSSP
jgi:hypothetical protein